MNTGAVFKSLAAGLVILFAFAVQAEYNSMTVFGDSLSDQDNLNSTGQVPFLGSPPYDGGRFSNGPLAVEHLAQRLGLDLEPSLHLVGPPAGTNYAVAAATAGGDTPLDLTTQLGAFLLANPGGAPSGSLYILFFGGNDIRATRDMRYFQARLSLFLAVLRIETAAHVLIGAGAENVMVMNAPDIGKIPEIQAASITDPQLAKKMTHRSRIFNYYLGQAVKRLQRNNDAHIVPVDIFSLFTFFSDNGEDLGYLNWTNACFVQATMPVFRPDCNFDKFLFFDTMHPTAVTHARASNALLLAVPDPG